MIQFKSKRKVLCLISYCCKISGIEQAYDIMDIKILYCHSTRGHTLVYFETKPQVDLTSYQLSPLSCIPSPSSVYSPPSPLFKRCSICCNSSNQIIRKKIIKKVLILITNFADETYERALLILLLVFYFSWCYSMTLHRTENSCLYTHK